MYILKTVTVLSNNLVTICSVEVERSSLIGNRHAIIC